MSMRRYYSYLFANIRRFTPIIESNYCVPKINPSWATSSLVKFRFLLRPNSFVSSERPFCSEFDTFDRTLDCNLSGGGGGVVVAEHHSSDGELLYNTVMSHSFAYLNMEKGLDEVGVNLTSQLVLEVIHRLRFEERLAFRFFTWVGHQEGYTHEARAYNDMIDILSSTRYKARQFGIVCDMLEYMKRRGKNAVPLDALLKMLGKYAEKHLTHLHKFAHKKRLKLKKPPEIDALNMLLDALCKCGLVGDAEAVLGKVKRKLKPDDNSYNILFFGWCRVRNPGRGMKVLEEMIQMGYTPDNFTYFTAIDTLCKAGMVTEAGEFLEVMRTKGSTLSSPTAKSYAIMIVALVKSDRMEECFNVLDHMINSGCLPDVSTYKEMLEGMCSAGKVEEAYKVFEIMGNKGFPPDILTFNCFLKVLCDNKNSEEALRLYGRMLEAGCEPSVQTYNMLISMFFEMCDPDGAFETWHEMEKRGCARDTDTYCAMIEGLFGCDKGGDACLLLEDVLNMDMKLPYQKYDLFLMQLSEIGDLRAIHRLSEHMRRFYNPAMARHNALKDKRKSTSLRGK